MFVHESVAEEFLTHIKQEIVGFYGPEIAKSGCYGRMVRHTCWDRLMAMVDADSDKIVRGTDEKPNRDDRFMPPTILDFGTDFTAFKNAKCMEHETFGPVVPLFRFDLHRFFTMEMSRVFWCHVRVLFCLKQQELFEGCSLVR